MSLTHARPRGPRRAAVGGGGGATLTLAVGTVLIAGPASAHVTVDPREAASGGYSKLSFRVPDESGTAGTTQVAVSFPTDTPLASVSVKPHPGWDAQVTRSVLPAPVTSGDLEITEAVTGITWVAQEGVRISPGQFEEFDVSVGPLPAGVGFLSFPTTQTYDDGEVVAWDDPVPAGGGEPERPAPTLTLTSSAATGGAAPAGPAASAGPATAAPAASATSAAGSADGPARALGAAGLAAGVLGLVVAALAVRSARRGHGG